MTEKSKIKLDNVISKFPDEYKELFKEIVEYVISLGYNPKVNINETYVDFVKSKHGKIIMKIECGYEKSPAIKIPRLNIRFDALPNLYGIFEEAVLYYKKVNCSRCGKCDGKHGLKYILSNKNEVYICRYTIYIPTFNITNILLIKEALKIQDHYLMDMYTS